MILDNSVASTSAQQNLKQKVYSIWSDTVSGLAFLAALMELQNFSNNALLKEEPKRGHIHYSVYACLLHKGTNQNCLVRLTNIQKESD